MKTKKRKQPTEAQKKAAAEKRATLRAMSAKVPKEAIEITMNYILGGFPTAEAFNAANMAAGIPALFWGISKINDGLQRMHSQNVGQKKWGSFKSWKEEGFLVQKGEKGSLIWGKPRRMKGKAQAENVETGKTEELEKSFSAFPSAYIFHAGQVKDDAGNRPPEYIEAEPEAPEMRKITDLEENEQPQPGELLLIA